MNNFYLIIQPPLSPYLFVHFFIASSFQPFEPDTRPWHIKAAVLLNLLDSQYHIDIEKDWHSEYNCYISFYGQEDEKIGILCSEKFPSTATISRFINFVEKRRGSFHKLIIAVSDTGIKSSQNILNKSFEIRYEEELLNDLISFTHYQRYINKLFTKDTLENSKLTLQDIYVPTGGHIMTVEKGKLNRDIAVSNVEEFVLNWIKDENTNQNEHLAILGEYGQGKSVLSLKIIKELLDNSELYGRLPILIELRGLSPRNSNELGILGHWANRFQAKAEALWELHKAGKLLIILDGFDEMDMVGDTELLFNHFNQLWSLARVPHSRIIITGRPNLFADDEERRMALGIQSPRTDLPYAKAIYLDKLTQEQIELVLRNVSSPTKTGILNALHKASEKSSFAELITRPSTLYQLSTVWDSELEKQKERLNSAIVIESFLQKTYERQERNNATFLTAHERSYFMMGIAVGMMLKNGYTNQIRNKDLENIIRTLAKNYPPKLPPYKDSMAGQRVKDTLPVRLRENTEALETLIKDVRAEGILVQDLSGRDMFRFAHKSYMEYLVSVFYAGFILQKRDNRTFLMMINSIKQSFNFKRTQIKLSTDVEQFSAEYIAAQIELTDNKGLPLPIEGNELKYSKALYNKIIPGIFARFFPVLIGWIKMYPNHKFILILTGGVSGIFFYLTAFFSSEIASNILISLSILFHILILIFNFLFLKKWLIDKTITDYLINSIYSMNMRLYLSACRKTKLIPILKTSNSYVKLIDNKNFDENHIDIYVNIIEWIHSTSIFITGGLSLFLIYHISNQSISILFPLSFYLMYLFIFQFSYVYSKKIKNQISSRKDSSLFYLFIYLMSCIIVFFLIYVLLYFEIIEKNPFTSKKMEEKGLFGIGYDIFFTYSIVIMFLLSSISALITRLYTE